MEKPQTYLTDGVITLRRWELRDASSLYSVVRESLDHLKPWMPWAAHGYTAADAEHFIKTTRQDWETGEAFNYAIISETGAVIGSCGLMARIGDGGLEIGYWLDQGHTGRGLVTQAVTLLTSEAFRLGMDQVEITHDENNLKSAAVPRRLGFVQIETRPGLSALVGIESTVVVWQCTAETWLARSGVGIAGKSDVPDATVGS